MAGKTIIKEIKAKGNGQAIIYVSKIDLEKYDMKIGDFLACKKSTHEEYVKSLEKKIKWDQ